MIYPGSLENIIRRMAEAKDEALWKVLYIKCQHCGELKPIKEAVGLEYPPGNGDPRYEIWCKACAKEIIEFPE